MTRCAPGFGRLVTQIDVERAHEALVDKWRAQLETKQREIEALHTAMAPPKDLEVCSPLYAVVVAAVAAVATVCWLFVFFKPHYPHPA